jgi:CRP-like cAMP-binding protein
VKKVIEYINSISPISDETIKELESIFKVQNLKKNELFIDSGTVAKKVAVLETGIMRAFYRNGEGQEYNKHFFKAPCFIGGYSSLISGKPNQIIQQALTDCKLWEVDYLKLTNLYNKHSDLERMARVLVEQFFVQKEQREVEIVLLNADKRYQIFRKEFPNLEQLIPQYHIASYLGITPTQLSRIRRKII